MSTISPVTPADAVAPKAEKAPKTEKPQLINVGARITPEVFEKLEAYRWTHRLNKSEVIVKALESFCETL